jgi:hypothetical protein
VFEDTIDPEAPDLLAHSAVVALVAGVGRVKASDIDIASGNDCILDTAINVTDVYRTDLLAYVDVVGVIANRCINPVTGWGRICWLHT